MPMPVTGQEEGAPESAPRNLQELLEELRREGQLESSGDFTLDLMKAQLKLGRFQLPSRGHYLLKAVQACISAGASVVRIRTGGRRIELTADPDGFRPEELEHLGTFLLHGNSRSEPRCLRHLAVAINSAVNLEPRSLEVTVLAPGGALTWDLTQGRWAEQGAGRGGASGVARQPGWARSGATFRLNLVHGRNPADSLLRLDLSEAARILLYTHLPHIGPVLRGLRHPEDSAVLGLCRNAPVPVWLNGMSVNQPGFGLAPPTARRVAGDWLLMSYLFLATDQPASQLIGLPGNRRARFTRRFPTPSLHALPVPDLGRAAFSARVLQPGLWLGHGAMALTADLSSSARVTFVKDGVDLGEREVKLGVPGVVAVLSAHGLATDLTEFSLQQDAAYLGLVGRLREQARELQEDFQQVISRSNFLERLLLATCVQELREKVSSGLF